MAQGQAVNFAPNSLTFNGQVDFTTSGPKTVKLTNSGTSALNIASIATTGDFTETNTCGTVLAAGAKCNINVSFTPTLVGTETGTITITDNAPGSPQMFSLTGTGIAP